VTFKFDECHFYVKENNKSYDTFSKAVHQYYKEYFKQNELDLKISINVWQRMRDENDRTVDEMLEKYKNKIEYRDNELYKAIEILKRKMKKNKTNLTLNAAPNTRQVGQSIVEYQREQRENMKYSRRIG
jgi:deoxyhypusine synthase